MFSFDFEPTNQCLAHNYEMSKCLSRFWLSSKIHLNHYHHRLKVITCIEQYFSVKSIAFNGKRAFSLFVKCDRISIIEMLYGKSNQCLALFDSCWIVFFYCNHPDWKLSQFHTFSTMMYAHTFVHFRVFRFRHYFHHRTQYHNYSIE